MSRNVPVPTEKAPAWASGLSDKEWRWVLEYLVDLNARQATLRCGFAKGNVKSATEIGSRFKRRLAANISAALAERSGITATAVVSELGAVAFSRITDFLKLENGRLVLTVSDLSELSEEAKAAIAKLRERVNDDGSVSIEVELHDKLGALDKLGKSIGLFKERAEVTHIRDYEAEAEAAEDVRRRIDERLKQLRRALNAETVAEIEPPVARVALPIQPVAQPIIDAE